MITNNCISDIKAYHDALFGASITDKDKVTLTSIITLLVSSNYKKFETDYSDILLKEGQSYIGLPSERLVNMASDYLISLHIDANFEKTILTLWTGMKAKNSLNTFKNGEYNLINIIKTFIEKCKPYVASTKKENTFDFLGKMFAELNGKGAKGKTGIVLTPTFLADFMTDLLKLDYKKDIVFDACCGSGTFLTMAYMKMYNDLEKDFAENKLTPEEHDSYLKRLSTSVYGNDNDETMALLCLINFLLLGIDIHNVTLDDCFKLNGNYFDSRSINKGILNPPFEYGPSDFCNYLIERIKSDSSKEEKKFCIICPPQSMGKKADILSKILNMSTLKAVLEVQGDAFQESNISFGTSIFLFDLDRQQLKTDKIVYYDFSDTGYVYYKDSGLVDKYDQFETKKKNALDTIENLEALPERKSTRTWTSFFDIPEVNNFVISIDPTEVQLGNVEETDLTKANQEIKTILKEKQELIDSVGNKIPNTEEFENYLVEILSEVGG